MLLDVIIPALALGCLGAAAVLLTLNARYAHRNNIR